MVSFDASDALTFLPQDWFTSRLGALSAAADALFAGTGAGGEFTGWVDLPINYDRAEFDRILTTAERVRNQSDVLIVCGAGGSYLGARAVLELLTSPHYNLLPKDGPQILFTGNTLSADAILELMEYVRDKDFSVNVISKSGTTIEPSVAFSLFRGLLEEKYGAQGARERIVATTDARKGLLREFSDEKGYETFCVPDSTGGRYSVLTPVGLFPLAVAGIDVRGLLSGAAEMRNTVMTREDNPSWQYAAARHALYESGKSIEILGSYEPAFRFFSEWWKQLFGESEGKEGRGLFPASVELTGDLHSLGQYIQQGPRTLLETIVRFTNSRTNRVLHLDPSERAGQSYLEGKDLVHIGEQARAGTVRAHVKGGVPNLRIDVTERSAFCVGEMIYFFEFACGLSGYLLGVNPFDQPGVEEYKRNMFALLGRPGYEQYL